MSKTNHPPIALLAKPRRHLSRAMLAAAPFLLSATLHTQAASLVWDPYASFSGSDGPGDWNASSAVWSLLGADTLWTNVFSDVAVFGAGGAGGLINVSAGIKANGITFAPVTTGSYTLSGGTLLLGGTNPTITTTSSASILASVNGGGTALFKAGAATLTLDGPTVNLPAINITADTLATTVGGINAFGNSATALNFSADTTLQTTGSITVPNSVTLNGGTNAAVIGGATLSGPVTLAAGDSSVTTSTAATVSGPISGAGGLTKLGTQKLTLTGTNTYLGTTTLSNGSIQVGNGGTTGSLGLGNVANGGVLSFNRSDSFTVPNNISGAGSLVKSGAGTMTMTGASTYTGITTVSAGTLEVNGTLTTGSTGLVVVANGATLGGAGTVTGITAGTLTLQAGAKLSPGLLGSIATFTATSISWTSDNITAAMIFELSNVDNTSDRLALTGAFSRAATTGSYFFDFQNSGLYGNTYTLMTFASTSSTSTTNLKATNLPEGMSAQFALTTTKLSVTVVPEPSALLSLVSGSILLTGFSRLRRRRAGASAASLL